MADAGVGADPLGILDARLQQRLRDLAVRVNSRDDERSEEVALPAFVDAEVRLEHLRVMHLVVAELRFPEHLGLQPEHHKISCAFSLHDHLWPLFIDGHVELRFFGKI